MTGPFQAGDSVPRPTAEQVNRVIDRIGSGRFERTVRVVRDLLACLALLLVSVLMALALYTAISIGHRLDQIGDDLGGDPGPTPTVTGCPFGPGQCGG